MKKRRNKDVLIYILLLAMIIGLGPLSTKQAFASTGITVDTLHKKIFANGNNIILQEGSSENYTNIYIDTNRNGSIDEGELPINLKIFLPELEGTDTTTGFDLSSLSIFGGGNGKTSIEDTNITILSGSVEAIYGGGLEPEDSILKHTSITINGASFNRCKIYGGSMNGDETELISTNITINGGEFKNTQIFGGGQSLYDVPADVGSSVKDVTCNITINGGTFSEGLKIFGGGYEAFVYGNVKVEFNHGTINDGALLYGGGCAYTGRADVIGDISIAIGSGDFNAINLGGYTGRTIAPTSANVSGASITVSGGSVGYLHLGGDKVNAQTSSVSAEITGGTITALNKGYLSGSVSLTYTGGLIHNMMNELLIPVSFTGLTANGVTDIDTSTQLTLTFDKDPISLAESNITVTGATKGTLSGTGTSRMLTITDITVDNGKDITVAIAKPLPYTVTPASIKVAVYKAFVPSLTDITLTPNVVNYADRATAGTKVVELAVTGTPTAGITYTLAGSGDDDSLFQINGTELQIKSGTTLEDDREYRVRVKVCENAQPFNTYTKVITFRPVIPPTVISITRDNPSKERTNADYVRYRVSFCESVSGVDPADFVVNKTGLTGGSIVATSTSPEDASVHYVIVSGYSGEGDLRVDLKDSGTEIKDTTGNDITGGFTEGQIYTVDRTAPTLTVGEVSRTSYSNATVQFTSNEGGKYYYVVVASGAAFTRIDTSGAGVNCSTEQNTIPLTTLDAGAKDIYIVVKDAVGNVSADTFKIGIPVYVAPPNNSDSDYGSGSLSNGGAPGNDDNGRIVKEEEQALGAPATSLNTNTEDLKTKVFSANELSRMASGEIAKVILKVTNINASVSKAEKKQIKDILLSEKLEGRQQDASDVTLYYFDLSLYKQVGTGKETKVTQTEGKISISIEVPEDMRIVAEKINRRFFIIRIHNKVAKILEGTYDPITHLFTFETDQFSTYVLMYQDVLSTGDQSDEKTTNQFTVYNDFNHLRLHVTAAKTSQNLKFKAVSGAKGYIIYGAKCGQPLKKLATIEGNTTSYTIKNLKKGTHYKYQVKSYQIVEGKKVIIATSRVVHSITEHNTYANPTKVTTNIESVKLTLGKTKTINAQVILPEGKKLKEHTAKLRYESSNKKIATVSSSGKITAKAKGSCYLYVYAQNGVYAKIKITVK